MLAVILPVALLGALAVVLLRRSRSDERDSIAMFSAARRAMSTMAVAPGAKEPTDDTSVKEPVVVHNISLRSGYSPLFDPRVRRELDETRRSFRSDPRTLAHRPTVANLPRPATQKAADEAVVVALVRDDPATEAS
jgi:hypothetical protein